MMEDRVLPLIFLNLCGEMLYVILQRLDAQNISPEKTAKVIQDILSTMLNDQFIEELFKPQKMYTRLAMQSVFEKLVHSSIMRLNSNSMSKLYDLMLMVFKYQMVNCRKPQDVLLVTLNHLDAIKDCARPYSDLTNKVKNLYSLLITHYSNLYYSDYECLYRCINAFLENLNIRVSVLMKLGLQLPSGEIIIKRNEDHLSESEAAKEDWQLDIPITCFDIDGTRNSSLGTNIYILSTITEPKSEESTKPQPVPTINVEKERDIEKEPQGIEELSLLTRLIGKCMPSDNVPEIILASPSEESYELHMTDDTKESGCVVNIDASQKSKEDLEKICNELDINVEEKPKFDILDLLDTVEANTV